MSRKKSTIVIDSEGRSWDLDDFDLDSHGVVAPQREVFAKLAEDGFTPEQVSVDIQEKYRAYLERMNRKKEKEVQKAEKARKADK